MSDPRDTALRALVEKWRELAKDGEYSSEFAVAESYAFAKCADELSTLLVEADRPAHHERVGCKAEEWQRDGRGLWAMRACVRDVNHDSRHEFAPWRHDVTPTLAALVEPDDYSGPEPDINNELAPQYQRSRAEAERPAVEANQDCSQCGGPHPFDTSIPSVIWNQVIRAQGLPEYLCLTCIVRAFSHAGVSFVAELYGDDLHGLPIEVTVNGEAANAAAKIQDENNALRWELSQLTADPPASPAPAAVDEP